MMTVDQLRDWLRTLKGGDHVGVDEGGLILVVVEHPEVYWEIGGLPEDEGEDFHPGKLLGRTNDRAARARRETIAMAPHRGDQTCTPQIA